MVKFVFGCLLAVAAALPGQNLDADGARLWQQVLTAKGGTDRLHGINNVLKSSQHSERVHGRSCNKCQLEELFVFPDQFWYWFDARPTVLGVMARSADFATGHAYSASGKYESESVADRLQEGWRLELMQAVELLETRWMSLRPIRTWRETKKDTVTSIFIECKFQMSEGWATGIFTLDTKTLLPKQVILNRPLINDRIWKQGFEFLDYVNIDGIQMPSAIRHFGDDPKYQEIVQYQFNVDYDPTLFDHGPRIDDGAEGWRKR